MPNERRPKRPADVVGNAIRVAQIATGEAEEEFEDEPSPAKNPAAQELGRAGGKARAVIVPKQRRVEIARKAAQARWSKIPDETS